MTSQQALVAGAICAAFAAGAAPAFAHEAAPAAPIYMVEPIFNKQPKEYENLGPAGPYYPDRAYRAGTNGAAILKCHLLATGALKNCEIVGEGPKDFGFGPAARIMTERGQITAAPRLVDGAPVADEVVGVRVPFELQLRR